MNVLLVYAHPEPTSLNGTLKAFTVEHLQRAGHTVQGDNPAALLVPVLVVPVMLLGLGLSWFLASMGVFLRDLTHTVGLAVTALMFVSPVFYPLGAIPEAPRKILALNPLAPLIEQARAMAVLGTFPDAAHWLVLLGATFLVAWAGLWWFMRTKHAFADVV